ncbi:kazrin-A-like protein [Lasius niger]|uniref:Kazrin-A-like protein n=1 Tax=Lasius niger TaxID=67767 RepID=A0A0J7MRI0_LASNI|nr:kazrin-A-like protein [Lasius niger]
MEPNAGAKGGKGWGETAGKSIKEGRERGGSLGNLEDFVRRKRDLEEEDGKNKEAFRASKKTVRSPERKMGGNGDMLEGLIRGLINESRDMWDRLEVSLENIRNELGEWKLREERWKKEKEEIVGRLDKLKKKLEGGGEGKVKELDRGLEDVQRRLRKVEGKKGKLGDEEGEGD